MKLRHSTVGCNPLIRLASQASLDILNKRLPRSAISSGFSTAQFVILTMVRLTLRKPGSIVRLSETGVHRKRLVSVSDAEEAFDVILDSVLHSEPNSAANGGVAIDNKIEQAMDLVKSHLMLAVREEVEELKLQIQSLLERNAQLEQENKIFRAAASAETMAQLTLLSRQQTHNPPS